jgi:hypothetical protein
VERLVEITAEEYDVLRASGVWVYWDHPPFTREHHILGASSCRYTSEEAMNTRSTYKCAEKMKFYTKVSDYV